MSAAVGCMQTTTEEAIHGGAAARLGWTDGQTVIPRRSWADAWAAAARRRAGRPEVTKGFVRGCGRRRGRGWRVYLNLTFSCFGGYPLRHVAGLLPPL